MTGRKSTKVRTLVTKSQKVRNDLNILKSLFEILAGNNIQKFKFKKSAQIVDQKISDQKKESILEIKFISKVKKKSTNFTDDFYRFYNQIPGLNIKLVNDSVGKKKVESKSYISVGHQDNIGSDETMIRIRLHIDVIKICKDITLNPTTQ